MKKYIIVLMALLVGSACFAQMKGVGFKASDEDFINPERGFMSQLGSRGDKLDLKTVKALRDSKESMVWRQWDIRAYKNCDLPQEFLDGVARDFDVCREGGIKVVPRFAYCSRIGDEDAPLEIVLRHLEQLKPILQENADIIATMHTGFIGAWGEMHSSTNGLTEPENRWQIVKALLDILPKERCIQIRYPTEKADMFNGRTTPITEEEAFSGSYYARIGHHNDCFLASPNDVGTYRTDIETEKNFLHEETKYTPMGGETCNPRNDYPIIRKKTIMEMERMHWDYLNSRYSRKIIDQWIADGYYDEISKRLGYRLQLVSGEYQTEAAPGSAFTINLEISNKGFSSPFNPRMCEIVIIEKKSGARFKALLPEDPRFWFPEKKIDFTYSIGLPEDMPYGEYEVYLNLADPCERLYDRPEYSIRLANSGVVFTKDGYNDLGFSFKVLDKPASTHNSFLKFKKF